MRIKDLPETTSVSLVDYAIVDQGTATPRTRKTKLGNLFSTGVFGFIAAGVGAVLRAAQDKMRETESLKDYGGVEDGVTDDYAAWGLALAAATTYKRNIKFFGDTLTSGMIVVPEGITLIGVGSTSDASSGKKAKSRIIRAASFGGANPTVKLLGDNSGIRDCQVDSANAAATGAGVQLVGTRTYADNVAVTNHVAGPGFWVGDPGVGVNTNLWRLWRPCALNCLDGLLLDDSNAPTDAGGGVLVGGDLRSNLRDGLRANNTTWNTFIGLCCQGNAAYGARLMAGARSMFFSGGDLEANGLGQGVIEANSFAHIIKGPFFGSGPAWVDNSGFPERNIIEQYDDSIPIMIAGRVMNLLAPVGGGQVGIDGYAEVAKLYIAKIRMRLGGANGGAVDFYTKAVGGSNTLAMTLDETQTMTLAKPPATQATAPTIASANTIAPTAFITLISGVAVIKTITPPASIGATGGVMILVPTGVWTMDTSANIANAATSVVGKPMFIVYNQATGKWYPGY